MLEKVLDNFVNPLPNSRVKIVKDEEFGGSYTINFIGVDTRSKKKVLQETANGLVNLTEKFLNGYNNIEYCVTKISTKEEFEIKLEVTRYEDLNKPAEIKLKIEPQMLSRKNKLEITVTGEDKLVNHIKKDFFDKLLNKEYKLALVDEDTNKTVHRIVKPEKGGIKYLVIN